MKTLVLTRYSTDTEATIGRLSWSGRNGNSCYTLENPWRWNAPRLSCIPKGVYRIERDTFRGLYPNFRVTNVMDRDGIEFHRGNSVSDTLGCILLGESVVFGNVASIHQSSAAFDRFMVAMAGEDDARLVIVGIEDRNTPVPITGGEIHA